MAVQPAPVSSPAVVATGLTLAYGSRPALIGASFEIPASAITVLIGPNGSGKSTLLHAIAGLKVPSAGRLEVLGESPAAIRRRVAYVLQATKVNDHLPVSVWEVATMGRYAHHGLVGRLGREDRRGVEAALDRLGVLDLRRRPLRELSGGERQRVFVAQGLAQDADLLLLDEPVTGLDVVSRDAILEVLADERARGRPVIMSTHDLGEAAAADHLLLLAQRVVASGPAESVLTAEHLTAAYGGRLVRLPDGLAVLDDAPHEGGALHPHEHDHDAH